MDKPFSSACERNRDPILGVLHGVFAGRRRVLEIGSGTGQHAVHFAAAMPDLAWQCSDRPEYLPGIGAWLAEAALPNTPPPLEFDVSRPWPAALATGAGPFDAVFTANTLHIMDWTEVQALFAGLPAICLPDTVLVAYGPFNLHGSFSSESNAAFDADLKARAPHMSIRNREDVDALAAGAGFERVDDVPLPANNRCLVWQRRR